jgi:hypothetical protein
MIESGFRRDRASPVNAVQVPPPDPGDSQVEQQSQPMRVELKSRTGSCAAVALAKRQTRTASFCRISLGQVVGLVTDQPLFAPWLASR